MPLVNDEEDEDEKMNERKIMIAFDWSHDNAANEDY